MLGNSSPRAHRARTGGGCAMSAHRPSRARVGHRDPRCPSRTRFPNHTAAAEAAERLGSHPIGCRRCGGFHLELRKGQS
jgi:hypothetical protein